MPLYRGTVYKTFIGLGIGEANGWTNSYVLDAVDTDSALGFIQAIAALEKTVHADTVSFPRVSVKQLTDGEDFAQQSTGGTGATTAPAERPLPFWNTALIIIGSDLGRPERKFYRLPFYAGDVTGDIIGETLAGLLQDLADDLAGFTAYVGPNGESHQFGSAQVPIQMRQTDWNRRTRPGFVRGWVPV